jgi:YD repeat-containing protein
LNEFSALNQFNHFKAKPMKTTLPNYNIFLALLVFVFIFSSCDKKDSDETEPMLACKLTQVGYQYSEPDIIEYNAKGYVSKLAYSSDDYMLFIYDSNNRLTKLEEYDDNELYYYATYTYNGNNPSKVEWYSADGTKEDTETLKYDAQNRIIEIVDEWGGYTRKTTFTYNGQGNVEKRERFDSNGTLYSRVSYTNYDDKHRPYSALKGYADYYNGSSKNNPGTETFTYFENGQQKQGYVSSYAYTYNDKGFPATIVETYDGRTYTMSYSYQCN